MIIFCVFSVFVDRAIGKALEIWLRNKYQGQHKVRNMDEVSRAKDEGMELYSR